MHHHLTKICSLRLTMGVVLLAGVLPGCEGTLPPREPAPDEGTAIAVPLISEDEFVRLLARQNFLHAPAEDRLAAASLAARLNDVAVSGVTGRVVTRPRIESRVVLVARGLTRPEGSSTIKADDVYVAAISGIKDPAWAVLQPVIVLQEGQKLRDDRATQELTCSPRPADGAGAVLGAGSDEASAGLPTSVNINSVSPTLPINGAGRTVDLALYPDVGWGTGANFFVCAQSWPETPGLQRTREWRPWPAPKSALLIREADFRALLSSKPEMFRTQEHTDTMKKIVRDAALFTSAANSNDAGGVRAKLGTGPATSTDFLIVARDFAIDGPIVTSREFYVVPFPVRGDFLQFGQGVVLNLPGDRLIPDFSDFSCGPVMMPTRDPGCEGGLCADFQKWVPGQGNYGGDRWQQGQPRTTVTWPIFDDGPSVIGRTFDIAVVACTLYEPPPPPRFPYRCDVDVRTGKPILESKCDGKDDNCNGQIDEGTACDVTYLQSCPCPAKTCGPLVCGSIPDGCGNVLNCGACP